MSFNILTWFSTTITKNRLFDPIFMWLIFFFFTIFFHCICSFFKVTYEIKSLISVHLQQHFGTKRMCFFWSLIMQAKGITIISPQTWVTRLIIKYSVDYQPDKWSGCVQPWTYTQKTTNYPVPARPNHADYWFSTYCRAAVLHTLYGQMNYRSGGISLINLAEKILKAVTYGDTVVQRTSTKAIINSILIGIQIWFCPQCDLFHKSVQYSFFL